MPCLNNKFEVNVIHDANKGVIFQTTAYVSGVQEPRKALACACSAASSIRRQDGRRLMDQQLTRTNGQLQLCSFRIHEA
jgi:hypothetical protein